MKTLKLLTLSLAMIAATVSAQTAYQLPNPGFEQWDGNNTSEPTHWNTFSSSDGTYASMASSNHHYRRSGSRPGGTGNYYLTIFTKSILGIKANGNMTTGRIHAGAMSATSSENYNYTQRSNSDHSQPFTATPDSMYVWVSFYAQTADAQAQIDVIIHGDNDFRSPNDNTDLTKFKGRAVAQTTRTTQHPLVMEWRRMEVPFVYYGSSSANYMLINITTNNAPGGGDANDSLSIDDIEFIYSAWLNDITIAGESVPNFHKGTLNYTIHVDNLESIDMSAINAIPEADDANIVYSLNDLDDTSKICVITVTAEDGGFKTYTLTLTEGSAQGGETTGITNLEESKMVVSPNPTTGLLRFETEGMARLYTIQGQLVNESSCHGSTAWDISALPSGVYILKTAQTTEKIIKK